MMIITALLSNRLITTTGRDHQYYLPRQSLDKITIKQILDAVRSAEEVSQLRPESITSTTKVDGLISTIETSMTNAVKNKTLRDLL